MDESAKINVGGALVPGATIGVDPHYSVIVEAGMFLTPNWSVSFTGGFPPTIDIAGKGTAAALGKLGEATYGPATLTAQYRFTNFGAFQPYIGAGPTFMLVFGTKDGSIQDLKLNNAVGFAVQIGADFMINDQWGIFFDVKKAYLRTKAKGTVPAFGGAPMRANVTLDPLVIHTGVTFRF